MSAEMLTAAASAATAVIIAATAAAAIIQLRHMRAGNAIEAILSFRSIIEDEQHPPDIFLPNYWWAVVSAWDRMAGWVALMRQYSGSDGMYVDFEFLTVLSREWGEKHPDSYAHGYPRMPVPDTYPLAQESWLNEEALLLNESHTS